MQTDTNSERPCESRNFEARMLVCWGDEADPDLAVRLRKISKDVPVLSSDVVKRFADLETGGSYPETAAREVGSPSWISGHLSKSFHERI